MLYIKALHICFMVAWFAGLFYLPRLFVYHAMSSDEVSNARFKIMERKLYYFITPFMLITTALGLWMLYAYAWNAYKATGWLHIKLVLVTLLIGYHFYCGKLVKDFAADKNTHSHVFYRWLNELPVLILFAVVILVVAKPF